MSADRPQAAAAAPARAPLDVAAAFRGRSLLVTGATGFVGKVMLSMLLHRYPEVGRVFVLVRPGTGGTAEARFFGKVAQGRPFDPLREQHGAGFAAFMREKCVPVAGDVTDPMFGLSAADQAQLGGLSAVVNCAGLVDFNPSLELALDVNVAGATHGAELARATGAALVHVSTCFVAGNRSGVVFEDERIEGYFPRRADVEGRPSLEDRATRDPRDFDLERELRDCQRAITRVREEADDAAVLAELRSRAQERLRAEGRSRGDDKAERLALGRERRLWISQRLVALGMERAAAWGWPNTYTYTKSLGEQAIVRCGARHVLVRPSIVETALRYPFPGWNEGFTTSAPLAFLGLKGHRVYPMGERAILDIVPVDLIAAGTLAITAEAIAGEPERVYHLASGDANPFYCRRTVELVGLHRRRFFLERAGGSRFANQLRARVEPYPVSRAHYQALSAPAFARLARAASRALREESRRWGAPRLSALAGRAADAVDEVESKLSQTEQLFELFMPFTWENRYLFRCANMRALFARLSPADQERLPWDPHALDWRSYWLDVHLPGLEKWVFPGLEEESKRKVHPIRQHRDLVELLQAAGEVHRRRVALRLSGGRKDRYTYGELCEAAERVAGLPGRAGAGARRARAAGEREPAGVGGGLLRRAAGRGRGGPGGRPGLRRRAGQPRPQRGRPGGARLRRRRGAAGRAPGRVGGRGRSAAGGAGRGAGRRPGARAPARARPGPRRWRRCSSPAGPPRRPRASCSPTATSPAWWRSWPASSTWARATPSSRCCRSTTPSSSPAACWCRSRAAPRWSTSTRSRPTRWVTPWGAAGSPP